MIDYVNKILNTVPLDNKFFVEAGANDGVQVSNTLHLEKNYGWSGICIEPNYENFLKCKEIRKNSISINCALVSEKYIGDTISGIFGTDSLKRANGLMSGCTDEHLELAYQGIDYSSDWICEVTAMTMTRCLDSSNAPKKFDFLSLDVENYELEVLNGLNFDIYRPKLILMEIGKWYNTNIFEEHYRFMESKGYVFHSCPSGWTPEKDIKYNADNFSIDPNAGNPNFTFVDKIYT